MATKKFGLTVAKKLQAINTDRMNSKIKDKITVVNFLSVTIYSIAYTSEQCDLNTLASKQF